MAKCLKGLLIYIFFVMLTTFPHYVLSVCPSDLNVFHFSQKRHSLIKKYFFFNLIKVYYWADSTYLCVNCFCVTGVAQVLNRLDGKPFDDADQRLFEVVPFLQKYSGIALEEEVLIPSMLFFLKAFVIFCGLGINNTIMYDQVKKSWAKQSVALDVRTPLKICFNISITANHLWLEIFFSSPL